MVLHKSLSVVIPVYNGGEKFRTLLTSLLNSNCKPHEIIVVSDGESDESWTIAEEFDVTVVKLEKQGGPARARNHGARMATGEILFFVDADVSLYPDTITKVLAAFDQEPLVDAIIGSYDDAPSESDFLSQYKNLHHHYVHQTSSEDAFTFWGACGAIKREAFLAVGGFDESYSKPSIEDIELGHRLKQAGYTIRVVKSLQVKHLKHWGVFSLIRTDIFGRAMPWSRLILRDRSFVNDLNLSMLSRMSVITVYALISSLALSLWAPALLFIVAMLGILLLGINHSLYRFFIVKRGLLFTFPSIMWHWFYYFYSGAAFAVASIYYLYQSPASRLSNGGGAEAKPELEDGLEL